MQNIPSITIAMSLKRLISILLICFFQTQLISCTTLQEIISEFQPQLQQLRYKVRTAAATSNIRLTIANAYVADRISLSTTNIQQQLESLQKTVQQTQDSSSSDEVLENCQIQEQQATSSLDTEEFYKCKRNEQIVELRRKIVSLKGLLAEIDQIVTACLVEAGVETETLKSCLEESVEAVGDSLEEQENSIGSGIDGVIIGADKCVSGVQEALEEEIVEIANGFLGCIGNSVERDSREQDSGENYVSNED